MPRCTRCNALLGEATVHDESGESDATSRDPLGGRPGGLSPQPPPVPWSQNPENPPGWEIPPQPDAPGAGETFVSLSPEPWPPAPPPGESTLSLSPEPWAASPLPPQPPSPGEATFSLSPEPWEEPAIWQPPPPRKRRGPYLLIAAGVMVLAAVALGIVFWPGGSGKTAGGAGTSGPPSQSQGGTETASGSPSDAPTTTAAGADLTQQARAVDALLAEMKGTRSDLGSVVTGGCERAGLERIRDARQEQLGKARALEVGALTSGTDLKDALVRALDASVESNQRYLNAAPGCPSDEEVADINQRASDAKNEFIGYWGPVAEQAGLPARSPDTI
ncbi:hypothetical protein [Actinomadura xylanilytica]|uniref:hypothetical protein n=1 Tax=Actinomadura xylanilytica TaxID=887459 RepID=UPI00255B334D|nr:hypothetical protein [Actinomadura xylanilytica]MDL4772826.1 hypothetical protein [Actinomadura xylanilytica]